MQKSAEEQQFQLILPVHNRYSPRYNQFTPSLKQAPAHPAPPRSRSLPTLVRKLNFYGSNWWAPILTEFLQ